MISSLMFKAVGGTGCASRSTWHVTQWSCMLRHFLNIPVVQVSSMADLSMAPERGQSTHKCLQDMEP